MMRWARLLFESDRRRGLWLLLMAVGLGTFLQLFAIPGEGYAVPVPLGGAAAPPLERPSQAPIDSGTAARLRRGGRAPVTVEDRGGMTPGENPVAAGISPENHPAPAAGSMQAPGTAAVEVPVSPERPGAARPRAVAPDTRWKDPTVGEDRARPGNVRRTGFEAYPGPEPADLQEDPAEDAGQEDESPEDPPGGNGALPTRNGGEGMEARGAKVDDAPDGAQLIVLGPSRAEPREFLTFTVVVENARALSHAPLQLSWDPEVLEFVSAVEGPFLSSDGAATQFLSSTSSLPGFLDIALSRMPPARGIDGSGVLCEVVFLARTSGRSPIVSAGSRLLDADVRSLSFRRGDAYVSVD